jgi:CMP-N-acetylneuraminic acid synthetase
MEKNRQVIGLICARSGSKGIPDKNIRKFHDKPLIGWVIESAIESGALDRIIVSTDSKHIADIASGYGADIPGLRPKYLAADDSDQFDTHAHVFKTQNLSNSNCSVAILVNTPFLSSHLIKMMVKRAKKLKFEKLVTTVIPTRHPYYFQCELVNSLCFPMFKSKYFKTPINRQKRSVLYFPFFLGCVGLPSMLNSWKAYKAEMLKGFSPVVLNKKEAFDIDDEDDWSIAQKLIF